MITCPGSDRCLLREHKGYRTCDQAGECLDMAPVSIRDYRRRSEAYRAELERIGSRRRTANLAFLVLLLVLFWGVAVAALLGWLT